MKENYDLKMQEIMKQLEHKPKLLLHTCCGPCSTAVIKRLKETFCLTILYYNPNIEPKTEYEIRKQEQLRYLKEVNLPFIDIDYENNIYRERIEGLEQHKEGGVRCHECFKLRLERTAQIANIHGFEYICTSLTVSPHKDSQIINQLGASIANQYNINWLYSDFKKQNGYQQSIELANQSNLYRQNYCGCEFSMWFKEQK